MKRSVDRSATEFCKDVTEILGWLEVASSEGIEKLQSTKERKLAFLKAVSIVGEASNYLLRLSLPVVQNANIPWRMLVDNRNNFVHEYFSVDVALLWQYVQKDLLPLKSEFEKLLEQLGKEN